MLESTNPAVVHSPPPLRVLILEDNPRDARLMESELEHGGYMVQSEVTDSMEVFWKLLEKAEYDVILSDFNLRNWTAINALQILKRLGKDIPLIVVTGTLGDEGAVECIKHGAADYVLKDRLGRLPIAVDRALEERRLREERKRAGEALRESEERFRKLFAGNPLPMWVYDLETLQFLEVNNAALDRYGYSREEFLHLCITDLYPAEDTHLLTMNLAQAKPAVEKPGPHRHQLKDGRIILAKLSSYLLSWNGRPSALVVAQDMTERAVREEIRQSETVVNNLTVGAISDRR